MKKFVLFGLFDKCIVNKKEVGQTQQLYDIYIVVIVAKMLSIAVKSVRSLEYIPEKIHMHHWTALLQSSLLLSDSSSYSEFIAYYLLFRNRMFIDIVYA